jgi:hypothetical protein
MAITKVSRNLLSTGIDDQSNATAITIDSSENVMVGQSSTTIPGVDNTTAGVSIRGIDGSFFSRSLGSGDANNVVSINRSTADGNILGFQKDGTTVGRIGTVDSRLFIGNDDTFLTFQGASDRIYPATSTGDVRDAAIDLGLDGGRFKDLYLSGGVYLGGTGAANKLDDYEEVNFTATLRGATAEPGTLLTVTGFATKIGRVVQYSIGFENVDTTGYAGLVTVTGLPFTNNGGRAIGNLVAYNGLTWTGSDCFSVINVNATILEALNISSAAPWGNSTHDPGATRFFWFTGTYMTTA